MASAKLQIIVQSQTSTKKISQTINNVRPVFTMESGTDTSSYYAEFGQAIAGLFNGEHLETRYIEQTNLPIT